MIYYRIERRCGYTWVPRRPETAEKLWIKCPSCMRNFKNPSHVKPILEAINELFEKLKSDYPIYFNELERARVLTINIIKNGIDDGVFDQIITTIKNKKEYNFQT